MGVIMLSRFSWLLSSDISLTPSPCYLEDANFMREVVFVRNNDFNLFDFKNNGRKHTDFFSRFSSPEPKN